MSRIAARFDSLGRQQRKALIPYITAGDPEPSITVPLMHAMVAAGADLIELGVPFSDPMADGPVIQAACERALHHKVALQQVLAMTGRFREQDEETPLVLMGYLNPVEVMGYEQFAEQAAEVGVDGQLTVDLPPEEADGLLAALKAVGVDPIFLIAPTSSADRIRLICKAASGFVYYVSLKGVTGADKLDVNDVGRKLADIRRFSRLPVGVGFGIKDPASAAQVARVADAVVVGSSVVRRVAANARDPDTLLSEVTSLLGGMRAAMDVQSEQESAVL